MWDHDHRPAPSLLSEGFPVCPTNPAWEEWECKAQGLNLVDTMQEASLEVLTTFLWEAPWCGSRHWNQGDSFTW
jgi:hypothetical protein